MTNLNRTISNFEVDPMNDDESFDVERLSGSFRFDDELDRTAPTTDYETIRKSKKKPENSEKLDKKTQKKQEKERKKSASRTRTDELPERRSSGRSIAKIIKLDGSEENFQFKKDELGKSLFGRVTEQMQIEEKDYFGLKYFNSEQISCWLDNDKRVRSQLKGVDAIFYFQVKFYPPEPALLQEDLTRYQLCLQLRNDITTGKLPCSFITYALLGSYTAQAELGDYDENDQGIGFDYLKQLQFAPVQDDELLRRIHEQHKRHRGQPPNAADLHFLENAKKLAMYGVDIHPAQDSENVDINIGVSANGLLIYRDKLRINRFAWPKILKISYKRKYFFIKLRPSEFDQYESTIGFKLLSYRAAKSLWKIAVEHHAFFRLRRPEEIRKKAILPRFNSTFRYTGNYTYHQARQMLLDRPNPEFERNLSKRMTKSMDVLEDDLSSATTESNRSNVQRPMARPQSVEPFYQTHRIPLNDQDENYRTGNIKDPEYAHVTRKPQRIPAQQVPVTPPRTPKPTETKNRPGISSNPTYVNIATTPPPRPPPVRQSSPTMDPDEALLAAIRLATDLDPNKQAEQIVLPNN